MRRLPVLAALMLSAVIGRSAWLAIGAQSDPETLPTAEHLPRDDEQAQEQELQAEPEPGPNEGNAERESAEHEASEEETSEELREEDIEPTEPAGAPPTPTDVLIEALDVPRPIIAPEAPPPSTSSRPTSAS